MRLSSISAEFLERERYITYEIHRCCSRKSHYNSLTDIREGRRKPMNEKEIVKKLATDHTKNLDVEKIFNSPP